MAAKKPDIQLFNGKYRIPIWIEEGVNGIREISASPNSIFLGGGGAGRYGDAEPMFATNEQRSWEGGRGIEHLVDDTTRYFDGWNAWTLTPGRVGPTPQAFFGRGYRPNGSAFSLPGNMTFRPLYGDSLYIARSFDPGANITADLGYAWVRRVGTPNGNLTFALYSDSSGPNTALKTKTVSITDIDDYESRFVKFDWTSTESLSSGTTYWVVVYGDTADDRDGHWEVGTDVTAAGKSSTDGSTWSTYPYALYYKIDGADIAASHKFFFLDEALYAVSIYDSSTSSRLWLNGDRGAATSGSTTTVVNSGAAFGTSSEYVGARVKIIRGTGAGQSREITSHTGTALTVSPALDIAAASGSEYIIYQTPRWKEIASTGLGRVESVATYANQRYIAVFGHKASGDPIRKIWWNVVHSFGDDSTNEANILATQTLAGTGTVLWRAVNGDASTLISRATASSAGGSNTFGTAFGAGNQSYPVTNMVEFTDGANSRMYILKPNELGMVDSDKFYHINVSLDAFPEQTNGKAAVVHGLYLYFNWSWSMERLYGTALDDIDPNRDAGLPSDRQGYISAIASHPVGVAFGIDAGADGYSSVMFFDGFGFHEIFRAPVAGKRIRDLKWQANEGGKKYLWISVGDDLMYIEFPRFHRDPFRDSTQNFMHEFSLTTATFDMGNTAIQKVWKDVTLITRNLNGTGIKAALDYQVDEDIDTDTWTQVDAGEFRQSPRAVAKLFVGESTQIRFRIRLRSTSSTTPPIVNGIVVKGVGQYPYASIDTFWGTFGKVAKLLGGSETDSIQTLTDGYRNASVWVVEDSVYKRSIGRKVLAEVVQVDPQYTLQNKDNVRAQIRLISLDESG